MSNHPSSAFLPDDIPEPDVASARATPTSPKIAANLTAGVRGCSR